MHLEPHHSPEELAELARRGRGRPGWIKLQALALAARGRAAAAIAEALGCCARSVQKWVARYNDGGVEALGRRPGQGRRPRLPVAEHARLRARIEAGPTPEDGVCAFHGPDVRRILRDEFGVELSEPAVYDNLHRLGLSSLMPRPIHRKADPAAQEAFKKNPDAVAAVAAARPDERVEVWFADEARFGRQGTLTRVWAAEGSRPPGVRQTEYDWCYVLTAACPATGRAAGLVMPRLDIPTVEAFLAVVSARLDPGAHAVPIWDNAGYHTGRVAVPPNITLLPLPPYSPELNPIENLWHYLRSRHWSLRVYRDYEALVGAAIEAWRAVCLAPDLVRSVCAAPYMHREPNS